MNVQYQPTRVQQYAALYEAWLDIADEDQTLSTRPDDGAQDDALDALDAVWYAMTAEEQAETRRVE